MHKSSMLRMCALVDAYIDKNQGKRVLDVGAYNVNGCYRDLFLECDIKYDGMDIESGPNIDIVVEDIYEWKEIKDESYDYIISGQALEHMSYPWLAMQQIYMKLKKEGIACIIAPNGTWEHRYPLDCYRYFSDGMTALAQWAGFYVIESSVAGIPDLEASPEWDDICNDACVVVTKSEKIYKKYSGKKVLNYERRYEPLLDFKMNYNLMSKWQSDELFETAVLKYIDNSKVSKVLIVGDDAAGKALEKVLMNANILYEILPSVEISFPIGVSWKEGRVRERIEVGDDTLVVLTVIDYNRNYISEAKKNGAMKVEYLDNIARFGKIIEWEIEEKGCYLYGAGTYGEKAFEVMKAMRVPVNGFVVSDEKYDAESKLGLKIKKISELGKNVNIIVAIQNNKAIMEKLKNLGYIHFIDYAEIM